jgi:hypothetical protein
MAVSLEMKKASITKLYFTILVMAWEANFCRLYADHYAIET